MNRCYQCKNPIAIMLKLRSLSFEPGYHCPRCGAGLSFSLWAFLCVMLSVLTGLLVGVYLTKSVPIGEMFPLFLFVWGGVSLIGVLLTAVFLPLVPYKNRLDNIIIAFVYAVFGFGFAIIGYALFQVVWPF